MAGKKQIPGLRIGGKRYKIFHSVEGPVGDLGSCNDKTREIYIPYDGLGVDDLDVIIHELLHGAFPYLTEHEVDRTATAIARFLWRLGWRRED